MQEELFHLKCSQLKEKLEQKKMSWLISDKLAPDDVYRGRTTKKDENPFLKITDVESIKQQEVEKNKVGTETLKEYDSGLKTGQKQGSYGPMSPKLSTFDGKVEWKPYYMQFIHIANRYKWDNKQKLDKLIECLRDKALKYYSTRQPSVQNDFDALAEKMNIRFGNKDLPYTIRRQLQDAKQNLDETVEEFAERVQEMATDGYGINTPENVVETISVDAFLKGCTDKKAALLAMEKNPVTLDQALKL